VFRKEVNFGVAKEVSGIVRERYEKEETDSVYLLNNEMVTRANYKPILRKFLPFEVPEGEEIPGIYNFEIEQGEVLSAVINLYLNYQIYRAMVESNASEHFARMDELVKEWTMIFNKARQEAITSELIDIVTAAEAMK